MAVNACTALASVMRGFCGPTTKTWSVAELPVTARVVEPFTPPRVALMALEPVPTEVARPFEPDVLLMVATVVVAEDQVTVDVMFCVLASL